MSKRNSYWGIVLTIVEAGTAGDVKKARAYTELLETNLRASGDVEDVDTANRLQRILKGESQRSTFHLTSAPEYQQYEERVWHDVEQRWPEIKKLSQEAEGKAGD